MARNIANADTRKPATPTGAGDTPRVGAQPQPDAAQIIPQGVPNDSVVPAAIRVQPTAATTVPVTVTVTATATATATTHVTATTALATTFTTTATTTIAAAASGGGRGEVTITGAPGPLNQLPSMLQGFPSMATTLQGIASESSSSANFAVSQDPIPFAECERNLGRLVNGCQRLAAGVGDVQQDVSRVFSRINADSDKLAELFGRHTDNEAGAQYLRDGLRAGISLAITRALEILEQNRLSATNLPGRTLAQLFTGLRGLLRCRDALVVTPHQVSDARLNLLISAVVGALGRTGILAADWTANEIAAAWTALTELADRDLLRGPHLQNAVGVLATLTARAPAQNQHADVGAHERQWDPGHFMQALRGMQRMLRYGHLASNDQKPGAAAVGAMDTVLNACNSLIAGIPDLHDQAWEADTVAKTLKALGRLLRNVPQLVCALGAPRRLLQLASTQLRSTRAGDWGAAEVGQALAGMASIAIAKHPTAAAARSMDEFKSVCLDLLQALPTCGITSTHGIDVAESALGQLLAADPPVLDANDPRVTRAQEYLGGLAMASRADTPSARQSVSLELDKPADDDLSDDDLGYASSELGAKAYTAHTQPAARLKPSHLDAMPDDQLIITLANVEKSLLDRATVAQLCDWLVVADFHAEGTPAVAAIWALARQLLQRADSLGAAESLSVLIDLGQALMNKQLTACAGALSEAMAATAGCMNSLGQEAVARLTALSGPRMCMLAAAVARGTEHVASDHRADMARLMTLIAQAVAGPGWVGHRSLLTAGQHEALKALASSGTVSNTAPNQTSRNNAIDALAPKLPAPTVSSSTLSYVPERAARLESSSWTPNDPHVDSSAVLAQLKYYKGAAIDRDGLAEVTALLSRKFDGVRYADVRDIVSLLRERLDEPEVQRLLEALADAIVAWIDRKAQAGEDWRDVYQGPLRKAMLEGLAPLIVMNARNEQQCTGALRLLEVMARHYSRYCDWPELWWQTPESRARVLADAFEENCIFISSEGVQVSLAHLPLPGWSDVTTQDMVCALAIACCLAHGLASPEPDVAGSAELTQLFTASYRSRKAVQVKAQEQVRAAAKNQKKKRAKLKKKQAAETSAASEPAVATVVQPAGIDKPIPPPQAKPKAKPKATGAISAVTGGASRYGTLRGDKLVDQLTRLKSAELCTELAHFTDTPGPLLHADMRTLRQWLSAVATSPAHEHALRAVQALAKALERKVLPRDEAPVPPGELNVLILALGQCLAVEHFAQCTELVTCVESASGKLAAHQSTPRMLGNLTGAQCDELASTLLRCRNVRAKAGPDTAKLLNLMARAVAAPGWQERRQRLNVEQRNTLQQSLEWAIPSLANVQLTGECHTAIRLLDAASRFRSLQALAEHLESLGKDMSPSELAKATAAIPSIPAATLMPQVLMRIAHLFEGRQDSPEVQALLRALGDRLIDSGLKDVRHGSTGTRTLLEFLFAMCNTDPRVYTQPSGLLHLLDVFARHVGGYEWPADWWRTPASRSRAFFDMRAEFVQDLVVEGTRVITVDLDMATAYLSWTDAKLHAMGVGCAEKYIGVPIQLRVKGHEFLRQMFIAAYNAHRVQIAQRL